MCFENNHGERGMVSIFQFQKGEIRRQERGNEFPARSKPSKANSMRS